MADLNFGELSILDELGSRLSLSPDEIIKSVKEPPREDLGDIALASFILSKKLGKNPEEASEYIKEKLDGLWFVKKVDVFGPYVNIFYDYGGISTGLFGAINESYGKINIGNGARVFLEHTSVNPNKALHIGHAKNACIGDSLGRLLRFVNYKTIVANYIDDTGAQVADDIVGIKFLNLPEEKEGVKLDIYLGNEVYVKTTEEYEKNPSLMEKRRQVLKSIEEGSDEIAEYAKKLVSKVINAQMQTFDRLGIYYDLFNHESHILSYKFWDTAFKQLKDMKIVELKDSGEKAGCWVFIPEGHKLAGQEKILVRSDGTVVYAGKDIAYAMWKHGLLNTDFRYKRLQTQRNGQILWETTEDKVDIIHPQFNDVKTSINIMDVRQSYEQEVVSGAIKKIAGGKPVDYIPYLYEVVALSAETAKKFGIDVEEGARVFNMSGRKGILINTDSFLDQLYEKVYAETRSRNDKISDDECKRIAEGITISTFRYELVKTDPKRMTVFDIDEALKLQEKNAVYILYTYARASSILSKAMQNGRKPVKTTELEAKEKRMIKLLTKFPSVIFDATKNLDIATLSTYISTLCFEFNSFYESVHVLNAEEDKRDFRVELVRSVRDVLGSGMEMLGLTPIERI